MRQVPDITTSRDDIVVDDISYRRPLFGLLGTERWNVTWRCVSDPRVRGEAVLQADVRYGRASLGGESFSFAVRWREDRRRAVSLFNDDRPVKGASPSLHLVEAPPRT